MTVLIRLNNAGSTYALTSGNVIVTGYTPAVGSTGAPSVGDSLELLLYGNTAADVQTAAQTIERYLELARARQASQAGTRIYLEMQLDADSEYWRSEIQDGRLEFAQGALDTQSAKKVAAVLLLQRVNFWESGEAELAISTSGSGAGTGGKTIENHDDAGAGDDNWVQIAAGVVGGALPTPARITLQNNSGASQDYRNIYIGVNAYSDPGNFTHMVEGESAAPTYGTSSSDSNSSNGAYLSKTFSGASTILLSLPAATLQDGAGRFFRLLARFASVSGAFYLRPIVRDVDGLIDLFVGDEVRITSATPIADLGAIPLPPSGGSASWAALTLLLQVRATASTTIGLDFIQLTPMDSYAHIIQRGYSTPNNSTITIDSIDGAVYMDNYPIYTPIGLPILLFPNLLQRLLFLHDEGTGAPAIANTFSVRCYYRKRRLTL